MLRAVRIVFICALLGALLLRTHFVDADHVGPDAWVRWGLLLALSFCGWGCIFDRFVVRWSPRPSLTLRTVWGLSVVVFIIGLGAMLHVATKIALVLLVMLGWVALIAHVAFLPSRDLTVLRVTRWFRTRVQEGCAFAALGFVGVYRMIVATDLHPSGYKWDDATAYFVLVKQLIQTGHFDQPFSVRRLVAYGGQTALQALLFCDGSDATLHIGLFDDGICALLTAMLIVASEKRQRSRALPLRLLAACVVFLAAAPHVNSAAVMSGVLLLLATWTCLVGLERQRRRSWRALMPVALVASAACTLRQNYISVVALMVISWFVARGARRGLDWQKRTFVARELASVGLMVFAFLAPWFEMSVRNFDNPLFPIFKGTYNEAAAGLEATKLTVVDHLYALVQTALSTSPIVHTAYLLLALGLLMLPKSAARTAGLAFLVGSAATVVLQVWKLGLIDLFGNVRYSFSYEIGALAAIATAAAVSVQGMQRSRADVAALASAVAMIVAGAGLQIYHSRDAIVDAYVKGLYPFTTRGSEEASKVPDVLRAQPRADPARDDLYRAIQWAAPKGETILVWLDEPYALDFARNRVVIGDFPAAVSPKPGLPIFAGEEATTRYLIGLGIHYVAFVTPSESQGNYKRTDWLKHAATTDPAYIAHKTMAPYWLALFDYLDAIAREHKVLFTTNGMMMVDVAEKH